jgi:5-methylcytosine-specific restriction endonuclease McrA
METPTPKVCRGCKLPKSLDEFGTDKYTSDGKSSRCIPCKRQESAQYRAQNPEKVRAATATWTRKNPEKRKAYEDTHKAEKQARNKTRYRQNKALMNAQSAAYYAAHRMAMRQKHADWYAQHPEWIEEKTERRRTARTEALLNDLTAAQWEEIKNAYEHRCAYCRRKMKRLTQDHITPLSKGGSHTLANVVPACQSCNSKKHAKAPLVPVQPLLLTLAPSKPYTKRI